MHDIACQRYVRLGYSTLQTRQQYRAKKIACSIHRFQIVVYDLLRM